MNADLRHRQALIADGHHRYATYRELQECKRFHFTAAQKRVRCLLPRRRCRLAAPGVRPDLGHQLARHRAGHRHEPALQVAQRAGERLAGEHVLQEVAVGGDGRHLGQRPVTGGTQDQQHADAEVAGGARELLGPLRLGGVAQHQEGGAAGVQDAHALVDTGAADHLVQGVELAQHRAQPAPHHFTAQGDQGYSF
ncbi:hypothetical protein AB0K48_59290 [Nonomuraea sp. NPDC055795]